MMESKNNFSLIAPCGMNCGVCMAYLREKNKCPGCRGEDSKKTVTRVRCKIKPCDIFKKDNARFCFECGDFPCEKLKHLDNRYRSKYNMSMIDNLGNIRNFGLKHFIESEDIKWTCSDCGGRICVHNGICYSCEKK
jgi:Protein of unknown function (DUF3795)